MFGSNFPNPPGYYEFSNTIRVDQEGNGDFLTVKEACDHASTLSLSDQNQCLIHVNAGEFVEEQFTIPRWCIVNGFGDAGESNEPATKITRATPLQTDSYFIRVEENASLTDCTVEVSSVPLNFNGNYAIISLYDSAGGGGGISGSSKVEKCQVLTAAQYNGANEMYCVSVDEGVIPVVVRCSMIGQGTSFVVFNSMSEGGALQYCSLIPTGNGVKHLIKVNNSNTTNTSRGLKVAFGRLYQGNIPPHTDQQALQGTIKVDDLNARVYLMNTRCPLNERVGAGTVYDLHQTPQQLSTSLTAKNRTVTNTDTLADRTIDAYTDGALEADSSVATVTVFAPVYANAINGQEFKFKRLGANTVTVSGNGVNIDGAATFDLTADNETITISKNDRGSWSAY